MQVYLAYSGAPNHSDRQGFDLIGVFQDKARAIQAVEDSIVNYPNTDIARETAPTGNMFWTEFGLDVVTVGYLECRTLQ